MATLRDARRLRIFLSDDDMDGARPLYEAIVYAARDVGLAGALVTRGIAGYGRSAHVHRVFRNFSYDLPIVVEIVDAEDKITGWLPVLEKLLRGGLVTVETVQVLQPDAPAGRPA